MSSEGEFLRGTTFVRRMRGLTRLKADPDNGRGTVFAYAPQMASASRFRGELHRLP